MKSRSLHIHGCHFPLPLPVLLRGNSSWIHRWQIQFCSSRNQTPAESCCCLIPLALVLLLVQKSARQAAPASWRGGGGWSWPCVRPVAGSGRPRQSWRTLQPPALCSATLHFPAVLRARNFVLRCRLVHRGGTLSYLQCRCALCWEQQFSAVPSAREIFNAASELELENVGTLWWRKKRGRNAVATLF